jgi:hypothetical protein
MPLLPPRTATPVGRGDYHPMRERVTVSVAVFVTPALEAEIVATDAPVWVRAVATMNVADVWPAATRTFAGTDANAGLELLSATATPPPGAAAISVTVPMAEVPPRTGVGLRVSVAGAVGGGGLAVSVVVFVTPW